jgi:hypothetical protein
VACRVERADLRAWLHEPMPVILVVYDAAADVAFWLYVQEYLQPHRFSPGRGPAELTLRIPRTNVVDAAALRHLAHCRDRLLAQMKGLQHSDEG